jgi:PAS domain S-box-containing protein
MQEELNKPNTSNKEIILDPTREIMSKTNADGVIEFVNDYFVEVSGYEEYELLGKTMHCTQHPDMPDIIFKIMWERLLTKQNFNVLVKNLAKDGRFYWAISDFSFKDDENGNLVSIYNRRKVATPHAIKYFSNLYKKLKSIEEESGHLYAEKYLIGHQEEKGKNIEEILYDFQSNLEEPVAIPVKTTKLDEPKLEKIPEIKAEEHIVDLTENFDVKEKEKKEVPLEQLSIKERLAKLKEIHEKTIESLGIETKDKSSNKLKDDTINNTAATSEKEFKTEDDKQEIKQKKKKGLFQKLFGKTEEELEEERRRKGK